MDFGGEQRYKRKGIVQLEVVSYGQAELGKKPLAWKYRRIQKIQRLKAKVQGFVAGPILQRYLGRISTEHSY